MNCNALTNGVRQLKILFTEYKGIFTEGNIAEAWRKYKEINSEVEHLLERIDPDQITVRDKIAKNLGLAWLGNFSEGLAFGRKPGEDYILVSASGEVIKDYIGQQIASFGKFQKGTCVVGEYDISDDEMTSERTYRYFLVDQKGEKISKNYVSVSESVPRLVWNFAPGGSKTYTFLNPDGSEWNDKYELATDFACGRSWTRKEDNKYRIIDETGKEKLVLENVEKFTQFSENYAFYCDFSNDWFAVDIEGNITDLNLLAVTDIHPLRDGMARYQISETGHYFLKYNADTGSFSTEGEVYSDANDFSDGLALVREDSLDQYENDITRNIFIDTDEREAFSVSNYISVDDFHEGASVVLPEDIGVNEDNTDGGRIYINKVGKALFPGNGTFGTKHFADARPFIDGVAKVQDQWSQPTYYIDKNGRKVFA